MSTKNYLKYYWLDNYLEKEVRPAFVKNHFLTAEEFFAIIFWKSKRPAKRIRASLSDEAIKNLTETIANEKDLDTKLDILLDKDGFDIAMASAVLTTLYPETFTVYDYRVREQVNKRIGDGSEKIRNLSTVVNRKEKKRLYWKYVSLVRGTYPALSLRDCDRTLWGESWYEDMQDFIGSVNNSGLRNSEKYLKQI